MMSHLCALHINVPAKLIFPSLRYVGSGGMGVILKSPSGTVCRRLTMDNSGNLLVSDITCP